VEIIFDSIDTMMVKYEKMTEYANFFANKAKTYPEIVLNACGPYIKKLKNILDNGQKITKEDLEDMPNISSFEYEIIRDLDTLCNGMLTLDLNYSGITIIHSENVKISIFKLGSSDTVIQFCSTLLMIEISSEIIKDMIKNKNIDQLLLHFIYNWDLWQKVFNTNFIKNQTIMSTILTYHKIGNSSYILYGGDITESLKICLVESNKISVETYGIGASFYGILTENNIKSVQKVFKKTISNFLQKNLGIVCINLNASAFEISEIFNFNIVLQNEKYIMVEFVMQDNYILNQHSIEELKYFIKLANEVSTYSESIINGMSEEIKQIYIKITNDTKFITEELEKKDRMRILKLQNKHRPSSIEPTFSDLVESENYTQQFLHQICNQECIKDPSLIQFVEPQTKVDRGIQNILLRSLANNSQILGSTFNNMYTVLQGLCC